MAKLVVKKTIIAPVERTFEAFSNITKFAEVTSAIIKAEILTDGPIGVGTRFRETRIMFGKQATEEMVYTAYEPHRTYTIEAQSHGTRYISQFDFRASGDGSEVQLSFDAQPISIFAKLLSPLGKLMMKSVGKAVETDFEDVKNYLEQERA